MFTDAPHGRRDGARAESSGRRCRRCRAGHGVREPGACAEPDPKRYMVFFTRVIFFATIIVLFSICHYHARAET